MRNFLRHSSPFALALATAALLLSSLPVHAANGGVALGATRVVYPADAREVSLPINNSDKKNRFLVQSWVEDSQGKKTSDFILTPPLFVIKPGRETALRIMYTGKGLPTDRESLYRLNSKAIPSIEQDNIQDKNVLQIAVLSNIKMFVRPDGLTMSPAEAPGKLQFRKQGNQLTIDNPTPYYVTLVKFYAGTQKLPNTMVAPKSKSEVTLPAGSAGSISYQTVNDYGAHTPKVVASLN